MNRYVIPVAFAIGLVFLGWIGMGFVGSNWLALAVTLVIAGVYGLGAWELQQFRTATAALAKALANIPPALASIGTWLEGVPPSLQNSVRMRIEGERVALHGPALTPYLVGLLVMLGMLGTFLGMVVTFKGAVFALEGSTDLQAIRSALAAPIKGLGLSFGTSVAGVAASAMLGLISALSRRERLQVVRQLDGCITTAFRPFSLAHQREESLKALQVQARALPEVVERLHTLMEHMEQRNQQLNEQLTERQAQFHRDVTQAYTGLAATVGQSLQDSLVSSAKLASETIQPVVTAAMQEIAAQSRQQQTHVSDTVRAQFAQLLTELNGSAQQLTQDWAQALTTSTHAVQTEWQRVGAQTLAQQQAICQTLETSTSTISARTAEQASHTMDGVARLLERSEAMLGARMETEAAWTQQHGARMDQLAGLWRTELTALRDDEAIRGQAAVERLGQLQAALAVQLASLGTALEEPLSRLMQTASEAPRAAAELIAKLRQEMAGLSERDNLALEERTQLMERLSALLQATDQTSREQRASIESLVASAAGVLDQASQQFAQVLSTQADKAGDVAAHVSGSAIELSSLGESFHHAVKLFVETNDKLVTSLHSIEGAVTQSLERSDEQLAYYVGQAREVIDLSLSSQKAVMEDLRKLRGKPLAVTESSV